MALTSHRREELKDDQGLQLSFYEESGCTALSFGVVMLPPGYVVFRDSDDSHTFWVHLASEREGVIHWDRWASWRGAWADYRKQTVTGGETMNVSPMSGGASQAVRLKF